MSNIIFIDDPYIHQIANGINKITITDNDLSTEEFDDDISIDDISIDDLSSDDDISIDDLSSDDDISIDDLSSDDDISIDDLSTDDTSIDEFGDRIPEYKYSIISIDIGIQHLGISLSITDEAFNLIRIEWVQLIDITKYTHEHDLQDIDCGVDHSSKAFADWIQHLFLEYNTLFEGADYILVERQPPVGLIVIEQLIYFRWRHKCHLIAPRSMHSYFGIGSSIIEPGDAGYEERKKRTQSIAEKVCKWHQRALTEYIKINRKHDITDSICLMVFWLVKKKKEYVSIKNRQRIDNLPMPGHGISLEEWFDSMKYDQYE